MSEKSDDLSDLDKYVLLRCSYTRMSILKLVIDFFALWEKYLKTKLNLHIDMKLRNNI